MVPLSMTRGSERAEDPDAEIGGASESTVEGEKGSVQPACEDDVDGISDREVRPERPGFVKERAHPGGVNEGSES